jgi:hypothetical protein
MARRCCEEPLRSITTKPEEKEISKSDEKIDPMNAGPEINSMKYYVLVKK